MTTTRRKASRRAKVLADLAEIENIEAELQQPRSSAARQAVAWDARQEFELLRGVTCAVTAELDFHRLVKTILDQATTALGAERGILFLGRPDAAGLIPVMAVNLGGEELQTLERVSRTILAKAKAGQEIVTNDAMVDLRFEDVASVKVNQMRSIMCAPLIGPSGPVGALYLDADAPNAFPDAVMPLFDAVARVAAVALGNARVHGDLKRENAELRSAGSPSSPIDRLIGSSQSMETLRRQAATAALTDEPVLIIGEPGSGRSLIARAIHDASARARYPFVQCDCSVVAPDVLPGMILGRRKTAMRGAFDAKPGLLDDADRGTLYLREASHLPDELGPALGGLLRKGFYRPLGTRRDERVDVRLMLGIQVAPSRGRRTLPMRIRGLSGLQLTVPALRERREDIPTLALEAARSLPAPSGRRISLAPEAMDLLQAQPWPGNVRALHQTIARATMLTDRSSIDADAIRAALAVPQSEAAQPKKRQTLQEIEDQVIRQTLIETGGNQMEAARRLGVHRNTILLKVKRMRER